MPVTCGSGPASRSSTSRWPTWSLTCSSTRAPPSRPRVVTCGSSAFGWAMSTAPVPPRCSRWRRSKASTTPSASSGPRSTPGSRRTSRCSSTPAARTRASTPSARRAPCGSSPRAWSSPSPPRPCCSSRPGSRPATTSTGPTSTSPTWSPSDTVTACPYKGTTSGYWSAQVDGRVHPDIAWTYDFPTRDVLPIAGLVAFYNEKLDIFVDGVELERPHTHFS